MDLILGWKESVESMMTPWCRTSGNGAIEQPPVLRRISSTLWRADLGAKTRQSVLLLLGMSRLDDIQVLISCTQFTSDCGGCCMEGVQIKTSFLSIDVQWIYLHHLLIYFTVKFYQASIICFTSRNLIVGWSTISAINFISVRDFPDGISVEIHARLCVPYICHSSVFRQQRSTWAELAVLKSSKTIKKMWGQTRPDQTNKQETKSVPTSAQQYRKSGNTHKSGIYRLKGNDTQVWFVRKMNSRRRWKLWGHLVDR